MLSIFWFCLCITFILLIFILFVFQKIFVIRRICVKKRTGFRLYVEDFVLKVAFILRFKITFLSDVALIFSIFWLLIVVLVLFRRNDDDLTKKYSLFSNFLVETSHSYHSCSYNFPNVSSQQKSPLFFYSLCMCYLYRC